MDIDIWPDILSLAHHSRPAALLAYRDERRYLLRVFILQSCVDQGSRGDAPDSAGKDDIGFDIA